MYGGKVNIKGFYEGSLIYGNRFRNTNYNTLKKIEFLNKDLLEETNNFIRDNLGLLLHNNKLFYEKIFIAPEQTLRKNGIQVYGSIFYYKKGDRLISQFHMSTGENLLISILYSLWLRINDKKDISTPSLLLLDEIELALHPSSLKRLLFFLKKASMEYNYAIYFSTHSIELISSIKPENIFFLNRHIDNTLQIINPCYPAYATRILYDHSGYDHVILVEDDLSRGIVRRILKENNLLNNQLVHVLPCGGFTNVIDLAEEVVSSNLVGKMSAILIILDKDVKTEATNFLKKRKTSFNIPLNYLPIKSLEKYLKEKLIDKTDVIYHQLLNDYIFHQKSLSEIVSEYSNTVDIQKDKSGKKLYELIDNELRARDRNRDELIELTIDHLMIHSKNDMDTTVNFLKMKLTVR